MSADGYTSQDFSPTESLIINVLVARYRLGDTLWTFESRNMPALRKLEEKGLVHTTSGVTENTVRAWLSDESLRQYGASWFQLGITVDYLPADSGPGAQPGTWTRSHLEQLKSLPRQCPTDPRAINTAHALMIQMVSRRYPVHQVLPGADGGVVLKLGDDPSDATAPTVGISPDGKSFSLYRDGRVETTPHFSGALYFTSGESR